MGASSTWKPQKPATYSAAIEASTVKAASTARIAIAAAVVSRAKVVRAAEDKIVVLLLMAVAG